MAKNPRIYDGNCFENWFLYNENFRTSQRVSLMTDGPTAQEFFWHFRPYTKPYQSSLSPIFLVEVPNLEIFQGGKTWLIRDGLMPLIWFFKLHPKPTGVNATLLLHEDVAHVAPLAWQKFIGTYRTVSYNQEQPIRAAKEPHRLLLTGLIFDTICEVDALEKRLSAIETQLGKAAYAKMEKLLAFSIRPDSYMPDTHAKSQWQYMASILKSVGLNYTALNHDDLKLVSDWSDTYFHDFNERNVFADSTLEQGLLAKGIKALNEDGRPAVLGALSKDEHFVALSPYHGMVVRRQLGAHEFKPLPKLDATIERLMMSEGNRFYPWPRWISEWASNHAKTQQ